MSVQNVSLHDDKIKRLLLNIQNMSLSCDYLVKSKVQIQFYVRGEKTSPFVDGMFRLCKLQHITPTST